MGIYPKDIITVTRGLVTSSDLHLIIRLRLNEELDTSSLALYFSLHAYFLPIVTVTITILVLVYLPIRPTRSTLLSSRMYGGIGT